MHVESDSEVRFGRDCDLGIVFDEPVAEIAREMRQDRNLAVARQDRTIGLSRRKNSILDAKLGLGTAS